MSDRFGQQSVVERASPHLRVLAILAILSACLYAIIALLSWRFDFDSPTLERPIVVVLLLFAAAFIGYLFAIRLAIRGPQDRRLLTLIIWPAILFRITLLFSVPIQEIDIYRYLWDGAVSVEGVSPFRYSPEQVRRAHANTELPQELARLVQLRDEQPAMAEVLRRVHFGELPTIYPLTSQAVFAVAALTTPPDASVLVRVFIMKTWFIVFDVATLFVLIGLLRLCSKPIGLSIIYAWCPLLMKEVANSGHLDAVAVFLTMLSVYLAARLLVKQRSLPHSSIRVNANATLVTICLALAIGAKLYPIILAPLFCVVLARSIGWRRIVIPTVAFVATILMMFWPMLPQKTIPVSELQQQTVQANLGSTPMPPASPTPTADGNPILGITTFLRRWEMNDFIFLVIVENIKPAASVPNGRTAWFSVVPEPVRQHFIAAASMLFGLDAAEIPFIVTRALTAIVFVIMAAWFAWRAARTSEVSSFCEAGFLTLAWFWLLCPTQNPWYWIWALPLLPFARSRAWLAVSGLVLLYYLRFWFSYHWPDTQVLGTGYIGSAFFDFIVTWIEFAPWLAWLILDSYLLYRRRLPLDQVSPALRLAEYKAAAR